MFTSASVRRSAILARTPGSLVVSMVSTSVSSASTPASPKEHKSFSGIAHHHPHNGMIDGIGCSERVNVDPGVGQRLTHAHEGAGTISKENCQLRGCFDGELGLGVHAASN